MSKRLKRERQTDRNGHREIERQRERESNAFSRERDIKCGTYSVLFINILHLVIIKLQWNPLFTLT